MGPALELVLERGRFLLLEAGRAAIVEVINVVGWLLIRRPLREAAEAGRVILLVVPAKAGRVSLSVVPTKAGGRLLGVPAVLLLDLRAPLLLAERRRPGRCLSLFTVSRRMGPQFDLRRRLDGPLIRLRFDPRRDTRAKVKFDGRVAHFEPALHAA